jgi:non-ribosomal peptide synthetase component F
LLSRYSRESEVLFGTTVSGRSADMPGIERMVGLFINTLPLRVRVAPDAVLSEWLRALLEHNSELRQFEQTPLVQIQGWSGVPRGQALFESLIVFDNHPLDESLEQTTGLTIHAVTLQGQTNYPLTLNVLPGQELTLSLWYHRNRFRDETATRMVRQLETLLTAMIQNPHARLGLLPLLAAAERSQVVEAWNRTGRAYPAGAVPAQIAAQAARTPEAVAVRAGRTTVTYAALLAQASRLAQALQARGIGPEGLVAVALERSVDLVVALLGTWYAGAAFVPLDPTYPTERLRYMLQDSQAALLLTDAVQAARLAHDGPTLCLDRDRTTLDGYPPDPAGTGDHRNAAGLCPLHLRLHRAAERRRQQPRGPPQPAPMDARGLWADAGGPRPPEDPDQLRRLRVGILLAAARRRRTGHGRARRPQGPGPADPAYRGAGHHHPALCPAHVAGLHRPARRRDLPEPPADAL